MQTARFLMQDVQLRQMTAVIRQLSLAGPTNTPGRLQRTLRRHRCYCIFASGRTEKALFGNDSIRHRQMMYVCITRCLFGHKDRWKSPTLSDDARCRYAGQFPQRLPEHLDVSAGTAVLDKRV